MFGRRFIAKLVSLARKNGLKAEASKLPLLREVLVVRSSRVYLRSEFEAKESGEASILAGFLV